MWSDRLDLVRRVPGFLPAEEGLAFHAATVVAVVGESTVVAAHWRTRLGMVFVDGGHGREPAHADYESWLRRIGDGC